MASILQPFRIVVRAVRAFFTADVHLRRGERGLEVVLDAHPVAPKPLPAKAPTPSQKKEQQELRAMRASLSALLDEQADNRNVMRYLAFVEHALEKKGMRAIDKLPYDVLRHALDQLETLVVNWSDEGLAALRSKMAVAVIEREPPPRVAGAPEPAADVDSQVSLAHPQTLDGEEAAAAEAALRAAYGSVVLPDLDFGKEPAEPPAVELHGELQSPSAKALARAARRGEDVRAAEPAARAA